MRNRHTLFLISLLLFQACCVHAADPEAASLISRVEEQAKAITSFTCTFSQERHLIIFPQPVRFQGTLAVARPDRLRWEFVSPLSSVFILNKDKGLKCDDRVVSREFDLISDPVMHQVAAQLRGWLDSAFIRLHKEYDITLAAPDTLLLRPNDNKIREVIQDIEITFDPHTLQPARVGIVETDGSQTVIVFSDYVLNADLPEALFQSCAGR